MTMHLFGGVPYHSFHSVNEDNTVEGYYIVYQNGPDEYFLLLNMHTLNTGANLNPLSMRLGFLDRNFDFWNFLQQANQRTTYSGNPILLAPEQIILFTSGSQLASSQSVEISLSGIIWKVGRN